MTFRVAVAIARAQLPIASISCSYTVCAVASYIVDHHSCTFRIGESVCYLTFSVTTVYMKSMGTSPAFDLHAWSRSPVLNICIIGYVAVGLVS